MIVNINGDSRDVPDNCTAQNLIELLDMQNDRIAMEVNMEIVPRSTYSKFTFNEGDNIEIVRAIGGGSL